MKEQGKRRAPAWASDLVAVVAPYLASKKTLKVGHNLAFEYFQTAWNLGIDIWHLWCTQEVERQFYQGKKAYFAKDWWGLDPVLGRYTGLKLDKTLYGEHCPILPQVIHGWGSFPDSSKALGSFIGLARL